MTECYDKFSLVELTPGVPTENHKIKIILTFSYFH